MKRNNKGFTLAELLIVIAIIAILIAIAIPAFSASLHSARLQTDHANIRSCYAVYRTAEMLGVLETTEGADGLDINDTINDGTYYFQKDGSLLKETAAGDGAYRCQTAAKSGECDASVGCAGDNTKHTLNATIAIKVDGGKVTLELGGVQTVPKPVTGGP